MTNNNKSKAPTPPGVRETWEKYKKSKPLTGFTIIELLVIVTMITVLFGIVVAGVNEYSNKAKITATVAEINELQKAVVLYYTDTFQYPSVCDVEVTTCTETTDPFLNSLNVTGWKGPYFRDYDLAHPWGGHISWNPTNDVDNDGQIDMVIRVNDDRPGTDKDNNAGQIPTNILLKIDAIIDDGNLSTGLARGNGSGIDDYAHYTSVPGEIIIMFKPR